MVYFSLTHTQLIGIINKNDLIDTILSRKLIKSAARIFRFDVPIHNNGVSVWAVILYESSISKRELSRQCAV